MISTMPTPVTRATRERLIIALDFPNAAQAQRVAQKIGSDGVFYKVGLELFTAEGPSVVRDLVQSGKRVFLDLKLHEIPNSVAGAVRSAGELGASMVTLHASGGAQMLQAGCDAARAARNPMTILAVTVLTSLSDADLREVGFPANASEQALRLAKLAKSVGCGGIVASPQEVAELRNVIGPKMLIVTPGIRPAGAAIGDQKRIATPAEAIRAGASHLVVGRPITTSADPAAATQRILAEMQSAL